MEGLEGCKECKGMAGRIELRLEEKGEEEEASEALFDDRERSWEEVPESESSEEEAGRRG